MNVDRVRLGAWRSAYIMKRVSLREPGALLVNIRVAGLVARGGQVVKCSARSARILVALSVGRILSSRDLIDLLYRDVESGGPDYAEQVVSKEILTLRMIGAMLGIVVDRLSSHGYSVRLVEVRDNSTACNSTAGVDP